MIRSYYIVILCVFLSKISDKFMQAFHLCTIFGVCVFSPRDFYFLVNSKVYFMIDLRKQITMECFALPEFSGVIKSFAQQSDAGLGVRVIYSFWRRRRCIPKRFIAQSAHLRNLMRWNFLFVFELIFGQWKRVNFNQIIPIGSAEATV